MDCQAILRVEEVERKMLLLPQADCPLHHHFGPGIYVREVHIPAGAIAIGHHQKTVHMNVMIKGRVLMLNEDGSSRELVAPMTFVGQPGRKVGYILEDVVWQNIYPTDETDVEKLEATYLDKSDSWLEHKATRDAIKALSHETDLDDYRLALEEEGFTEEIARSQSENEDDQIPMPYGWSKVSVRDSLIEGKGLFANHTISAGEIIAPGRIDGKRTPAGRYTNHAKDPNAEMVKLLNGDINLVAITDIYGCKGGSIGDEITIDYRQALALSKPLEVQ